MRSNRYRRRPIASQDFRPGAPGLVEYPFPLREKLVARLMLPRDLTVAEAKRLHCFMNALAVDRAIEVDSQ